MCRIGKTLCQVLIHLLRPTDSHQISQYDVRHMALPISVDVSELAILRKFVEAGLQIVREAVSCLFVLLSPWSVVH